jgi:Flp pilus assembly protein TadD
VAIACGANRAGVEPAPPWATSEGKEKAKTELAAALLASGNPDATLRLIGKMRAQGSSQPELLVLQGKAMARLGLTDDAEAILSEVARRHPRTTDAHNVLGILMMDQRRIDEAIPRFKAAVRAAPRSDDAHNNLGFALMAAGRHAEAITALRKALSLDSSKLRTRNNLGFALAATKQDEAALRVFRAGGDAVAARSNLAMAQEIRGDIATAKASYEAVLAADPDHLTAVEALRRLSRTPDKQTPTEVSSPPEEAPQ